MGLFDFLKKGEEKPVEQPKTGTNSPGAGGGFFSQGQTGPNATYDSYTVKSGDSLSKIAKNYYGDAQQWHKIHEANKDQISNPDLIQPGWVLKVPKA